MSSEEHDGMVVGVSVTLSAQDVATIAHHLHMPSVTRPIARLWMERAVRAMIAEARQQQRQRQGTEEKEA